MKELRYVREVVYGKKGYRRYWQISTDPESLPANSTWYVMTEIPDVSYKDVGNLYGCRNWVEYGLNQSKNELGWADFWFLNYCEIAKWWEIVYSAYLLVTLFTHPWKNSSETLTSLAKRQVGKHLVEHPQWDEGIGWKNFLNNLRLISFPFLCFNLIQPWLKIFPIP